MTFFSPKCLTFSRFFRVNKKWRKFLTNCTFTHRYFVVLLETYSWILKKISCTQTQRKKNTHHSKTNKSFVPAQNLKYEWKTKRVRLFGFWRPFQCHGSEWTIYGGRYRVTNFRADVHMIYWHVVSNINVVSKKKKNHNSNFSVQW